MDGWGSIEIIDHNGWHKEFPLTRRLIHVGSAEGTDVRLGEDRGTGVLGRHLQLVSVPGEGTNCQVINLGGQPLVLNALSRSPLKSLLRRVAGRMLGGV